ncbi:alkaline phosphatase [Sphingobacterium corticis]|uniref:Alkaline phosphatase n=1 Tax=Sphingobacterium corticis TaxID=1812823 RepID=A0ABW5NJV3_9SPHI
MKKHSIYLLFLFVFLASASFAQNRPKYIFYMIGDGMGLNQVHIAESYAAAIESRNTVFPLTFTQFPFATFATSFSLSHGVTDSAAAGTALSVGKKTKNGVIGMDSSRNETYKSIAYFAKESGMKVGVTTSVSIDHATPAAFYATQPDRGMYYEIGQDLVKSGFDFFAGAGFLSPEKNHKKEDAPSLFPQFEKAGYTLAYGLNDYNTKAKSATKIILMADKGASNESLTYAIDRKPEELTLQQITASAIQTLQKDNDNGFFLMVEGGKIDWACHSNDGATAIQETCDFDAAVAEAFQFYKQHPEETLIIVTADHETGGMVLGNGSSTLRLGNIQHQKISQGALSQKISDLRKASPNASWDQVKQVLQENIGLWNEIKPTEHEESDIKEAYQRSFVQHKNETEKSLYAIDDRIAALAVKSLNRASSISWASGNHSAAYIPIYAIGAGANLFSRKMDNVDIPTKIAEAAGWKMSTSKVSVKKK